MCTKTYNLLIKTPLALRIEPHDPEICGRPLGFDFDTISDSLIVADAYHGLWSVDLKTLRKTQLIAADRVLPGDVPRPAKIFNSVAIARNGDIYFTDSASDFNLIDGLNSFLANPSGRLFHYNRATKHIVVLVDRLHFANGLVLSPDESFVVVAETAASRLRRVHLTGPKRGTVEVFADGLPGVPDNLSADSEGIWVPLVLTLDPAVPIMLWQSAGEAPLVRAFTLRLAALIELPVQLLHRVVPTVHSKRALNYLGSFAIIAAVTPQRSTILRVDWNGRIVAALSGADGSVTTVAHVLEWNGALWLGSFNNRYLGKVPVPKGLKRGEVLFAAAEAKPKVVVTTTVKPVTTTTTTPKPTTTTTTPKPSTAAPKPTTTTPKPTTTTTTTTTTPKPTTTTTTAKPVTTQKPTTTTPKPTTTAKPATTQKPSTTTSKPAPTKPSPAAAAADVPPPPPTPEQPAESRSVPAPQPIEEQHEEPTRPPPPPKMKVIKRGGEQGEF